MKRFQESSWYVKLWRYRWYITIPFITFGMWFRSLFYSGQRLDLREMWAISTGIVQIKMGWYYTSDELKEKIKQWK